MSKVVFLQCLSHDKHSDIYTLEQLAQTIKNKEEKKKLYEYFNKKMETLLNCDQTDCWYIQKLKQHLNGNFHSPERDIASLVKYIKDALLDVAEESLIKKRLEILFINDNDADVEEIITSINKL
ncbi:unnamed protein product [Didymodactylos carnosus]|uniref:Uncharacterized protein n=1 Tax=Didymodactylos carnosus TaxID=1234261 RepID=A0A815AEI8_9BILA|nr:unnamed protein product [Didymodactylos carnosus]CAF1518177.1 unnamed protein product [Didymodactylos carnosus]CAF4029517.1 unnamed protein product [Didymodactylos carnosus]CAF4305596.1 unnamed protein product [Didymodactylos carnosus]